MSKFTKDDIKKEIEGMNSYIPVSKIEKALGMPPTTLQKVLSGKRSLPKKWERVLEGYFVCQGKPAITNYVADKFVMEVKKYPLTPEDAERPSLSPEEIKKEISRLMGEQIPKERDTPLGRKSWNKEQDKKIEELKKQLL